MKAAVHLDMVGGDYRITKSVLHVTHTPASLPSAVNTVADIFANYVIAGSIKAASGDGFEDALISVGGSKDSLVADITDFEMGSDHDVYQEGSFQIPTIYLRDWPDVFIHTNNDMPENIDPTKMKRSSFIAAASGYFLARAGVAEAEKLAEQILSKSLSRVPDRRARARALEATGAEGAEEARNLIALSLERDAAAIASVMAFAPDDNGLESKVESLVNELSGAWLLMTGQLTEQRKGKRIIFTIEPKEPPKESKDSKSRNPKDTVRPRVVAAALDRVPERRVTGPMNVYYYDYVADRAGAEDMQIVNRVKSRERGEVIAYEILNLVDGKRSIREIREYLSIAYGEVPIEDVVDYLKVLEKIGVVRMSE